MPAKLGQSLCVEGSLTNEPNTPTKASERLLPLLIAIFPSNPASARSMVSLGGGTVSQRLDKVATARTYRRRPSRAVGRPGRRRVTTPTLNAGVKGVVGIWNGLAR